jgi:hypothetical protein
MSEVRLKRAMRYTVQLEPGGPAFEVTDHDEAQRLFNALLMSSSDTTKALNWIVWAGRSDEDGGPPTGYILGQHTWRGDDD